MKIRPLFAILVLGLMAGLSFGNLSKEAYIDLEAFTSEIDKMECTDDASLLKESENEVNPKTLCPKTVERLALSPLGDFGTNSDGISDYLDSNYYKPLAYSMIRRANVGDLLNDLIFLDPKLFVLHGQPLQDRYNVFRDSIKELFGDLAGRMSDLDSNRETADQLVVDIVKKFHVYWNTLRMKNDVGRLKEDTKNVMAEIMDTYKEKYNYLSEMTGVLLTKLKEAYFRFLRAHKMLEVLNKDASRILAEQIVKRYIAVADRIHSGKTANILIVKEMHFILRTVECFHIVNYKNGLNEPSSISKFNTEIFIRIQMEYETYKAALAETDAFTLRTVRDFTVTLLLKCRHQIFETFYFHNVSDLVNYAPQYFEFDFRRLAKVYHETLDNLMMIPKTCVNFLALQNCAQHEANKVMRFISVKYKLKRSTSGWEIYDYTKMMIHLLFRSLSPLAYSNWSIFKQVYYQNLFAVMKNFQNHFMIRENDAIDELENMIGNSIREFRKINEKDITDFGVISVLEHKIYKELIDLKAEYNHDAPIENNHNILTNIEVQIHNFMVSFLKKYRSKMNAKTITIIKVVEDSVKAWISSNTNKSVTSIQVSNLVSPYVTNLATATYTHVSPTEKAQGVPPGLLVHPPLMVTKDYSIPGSQSFQDPFTSTQPTNQPKLSPTETQKIAGQVIEAHKKEKSENTFSARKFSSEDGALEGGSQLSV